MKNMTAIAAAVALVAALKYGKDKDKEVSNASQDPVTPNTVPPDVPPPGPVTMGTEADAKAALAAIAKSDGNKGIARLVEKVFRLETANFTSGLFRATNMAGQKALTPTYPWGWPRRGTVPSDYNPPVSMTDTGEGGAPVLWVAYKSLPVAMGYLAQYIRDHGGNAARWVGLDAARQAAYRAKLDKIATPYTDAIK